MSIIGIDLGTTKSVIGYCSKEGKPVVIPIEGELSMESVVYISPENKIFVGKQASRERLRFITKEKKGCYIEAVKRKIGKEKRKDWGGWTDYPQFVSAYILSELKYQAEKYLKQEVTDAIIAIPSHFDINQRRATKEAAEMAGINVIRLLNEATAASLAYGINRNLSENILIFDFGGGTLDISILNCGDGVYEVKCIEGDSKLGGLDYTLAIEEIFYENLKKKYGKTIKFNEYDHYKLKEAIENAKIELDTDNQVTITLQVEQKVIEVSINKSQFEEKTKIYTERAIALLIKALVNAKCNPKDIGKVIMIGRTSNFYSILERVEEVMGIRPILFANEISCVTKGTAIMAGVLENKIKIVLLLDATAHDLGIETEDGTMCKIIKSNTTIPIDKSKDFTTTADNQEAVNVNVYEGNDTDINSNVFVQSVKLDGIKPAARGVPQIEVTFSIDVNGILHVKAQDKISKRARNVKCNFNYLLTEDEFNQRRIELMRWLEDRKKAISSNVKDAIY